MPASAFSFSHVLPRCVGVCAVAVAFEAAVAATDAPAAGDESKADDASRTVPAEVRTALQALFTSVMKCDTAKKHARTREGRGAEDAARVRGEAAEHDARAHVPQPQRAAPLARVARQRAEAVGAAGAHLDQRAEEPRRRSPSERVGEGERRRAPELERRRVERGEGLVARSHE